MLEAPIFSLTALVYGEGATLPQALPNRLVRLAEFQKYAGRLRREHAAKATVRIIDFVAAVHLAHAQHGAAIVFMSN